MSKRMCKFLGKEIITCGIGCNVPGIIGLANMQISLLEAKNAELSKKLAQLAKENENLRRMLLESDWMDLEPDTQT